MNAPVKALAVKRRMGGLRRWWRARGPLALLMAGVGILVAGAYLWTEGVRARSAVAEARAAAAAAAAPYGSSLGHALNKRLSLVRGIAAFVSVEAAKGELEQEFTPFADALRASVSGVRNISLAPGFVVGAVNPVAGNERVLGNDLLRDPRPGFADTVRRAIESGDVTTHGPLPLIQGGMGLIARRAVFLDGAPWGAVGAVFDLQPMLDEANLEALTPRYFYGLRRADGGVIAGDPAAFVVEPVLERIHVPDGEWELAVAPTQGWEAMGRDHVDRLLLAAVFLGVGLLVEAVIVLVAERRAALARLVEERTRDLDRKAAELSSAKGELEQFAYVAAHDLQEPVRIMASYAQLLKRHLGDGLDEEGRDCLNHVIEGSARLKSLLHDVQLFIAEDRVPLPTEPQPADAALDAAVDALERRGRRARAAVARSPLPAVMADTRRLKEIFVILIGNALEYRHPDREPAVRVEARREDGFDVLTVADNGMGIEPRYHEQIFQVFRRLHRRDEHPGTGMGLAIARKMAERLGGRVTVRSEPGQGSVFSVHLPLPQPSSHQGTAA